jgi:TonB family protein
MTTRARAVNQDLFDDFRPGPFETLDKPAMVSHLVFLTLGALFLWLVYQTPVHRIEDMTLDQLPQRVTRLLLNQSDLAKLSTPERAAVPPEGVAPKTAEATPEAPETRVSHQTPPADANGVPGNEPGEPGSGGPGGGGGSSAGVRGAQMAAGVAQAMAATGALAEVDRIVGDFTGVVASERGGRALRQGAAGSGISRREGTPGAHARSGADLGGVDEILGNADKGGLGGRGTAGAGAGGGGGVGRAQVRIAAPAAVAGGGDAAAEGRTAGALMAVVQRHAAAVRFCYNRLLAKHAGASGQIVIRLTVAGDGSVTDASVVRSTLGDADLDNCVLGQAREWRFPPSTESRFVFDVPFVFTPPTGG